ncbi:hypothetical protein [Erwinia sp. B116]|uniref:hypothetical protein n=1 Tax=Erwinia sp. B116 TaxID=1561024 RepID=UPI0011AEE199|nr:hypothetical protein [Erwinia sp. B116]
MITRRNLLQLSVPLTVLPIASAVAANPKEGPFKIFQSLDEFKSVRFGDQELSYLVSYHQGKNYGSGWLIHEVTDTKANMVTTYPSLNGLWHRLGVDNSRIDCAFAGMCPDDEIDNSSYHQLLIDYADKNEYSILYGSGTFSHSKTVLKKQSFSCPNLNGAGCGSNGTVFKFLNNSALKIKGGSGVLCLSTISGIKFSGSSTSDNLLIIADQCGLNIEKCSFNDSNNGILMLNESKGGFSEFNVIKESVFSSTCLSCLEYKIIDGNDSFHGTGVERCVFQSNKSVIKNSAIVIGEGCLVYNAPLNFNVFIDLNPYPIIKHNGKPISNFFGTIAVEKKPKTVVNLVEGNYLYFLGNVSSLTEDLHTDKIILCTRFQANSDGSANYIRNNLTLSGKTDSGDSVLLHFNAGESAFVDLTLIGSGQHYRTSLFVEIDSNGNGTFSNDKSADKKTFIDECLRFDKTTLVIEAGKANNFSWVAGVTFLSSRYQFMMK